MRWNLDNGIELCHECHTKIHAKPFDWVKNEILTYNKYAELRRQSKKVIKYLDKKEVYNKLLQVYKGSLDWADYQSWWNNA
jgi:transposase